MNYMSATDAKNRFGEVLEMVRSEPVRVQKNGRDVAVVISAAEYDRLQSNAAKPAVNPLVMKLHKESIPRWGKVYEALAK